MTALLVLEDGTVLRGEPYGAVGAAAGELVFTTSMTGYQEVVTDPSYEGQIVAFTQPMIGNYGVEDAASESAAPHARALVVREGRNAAPVGREGFADWLSRHGVVGIQGVDTRAVTRRLRDGGAVRAAVVSDGRGVDATLALVAAEPPMEGRALAGEASRREAGSVPAAGDEVAHVALLDYGVKGSIVGLLAEAGARVSALPWSAPAEDVLATRPDGILLANGPGDPGALAACAAEVRELLSHPACPPVFGICLGHQLFARAVGLETYKLRFGHRGANHPVLEVDTGRVLVTTQNHGFAVSPPDGTPAGDAFGTPFGAARVTHVSLYDGTVEGLELVDRPAWSVQYHPEASPGPHDAREALARFVSVAAGRGAAGA